MAAKNKRVNEMLNRITKKELTYEQDPETDIALLLSEVRNNTIRIDLISKELLSFRCIKHKMVNLTLETIASLLRAYNIHSYGEYYYDEDIEVNNWCDCYNINNDIHRLRWAFDDLLQIIQWQDIEGGERTYLCTRRDGDVLLYYYGRDHISKDYVFLFTKKN